MHRDSINTTLEVFSKLLHNKNCINLMNFMCLYIYELNLECMTNLTLLSLAGVQIETDGWDCATHSISEPRLYTRIFRAMPAVASKESLLSEGEKAMEPIESDARRDEEEEGMEASSEKSHSCRGNSSCCKSSCCCCVGSWPWFMGCFNSLAIRKKFVCVCVIKGEEKREKGNQWEGEGEDTWINLSLYLICLLREKIDVWRKQLRGGSVREQQIN